MKHIVRQLDRYSERLIGQNRKLHVEKETHADLLDELEDRCDEVANVNIFLNNTINQISLADVTTEMVKSSLQKLFRTEGLGQAQKLVCEIEKRLGKLIETSREVFGTHFGAGSDEFEGSRGTQDDEDFRERNVEEEGVVGESPDSPQSQVRNR